MADLQIREDDLFVMLDHFASDFDIAEAILEGKLDDDLLFHSALNVWKADKRDKIGTLAFFC
jgi:hypothetical protein